MAVLIFEVMFLFSCSKLLFFILFFYVIFSGRVTEDFIKKAQKRTKGGRKISPSSSSSERTQEGMDDMGWVLIPNKEKPNGQHYGLKSYKNGDIDFTSRS